jgi:tRNA A37 threonylcarbamoyladenosine modification protein TsaB
MTQQETFILALDPVSGSPGASLKKIWASSLKTQVYSVSFLESENTGLKRYDSANFVDKLAELCKKADCKPIDIDKLLICTGPGAFSPIRVVTIISRVLYSLNPDLQVYKFNFLFLLFKKLKLQNLLNQNKTSIYLKAGLKGYFKEVYETNTEHVLEKAHLTSEMNDERILIDQNSEHLNFNYAQFMLWLLEEKDCSQFEVKSLDDLKPDYLREATVTQKKS